MAGTIVALPLSQRVDANGHPLVGWLLYLFVQNSSTPVNSYSDTALSILNPWPLEADASGMIGQFWLADGSYRVRATTNDGATTLFDIPSVLAIGPSTGSAPSGGVDPNAIAQTGDVIWNLVNSTRPGWVRCNGRTIGSATSGASERPNADCQPLFLYLWNGFSDALCPVLTGRGLTAAADWGANKKITLPDMRGNVAGGLDDMGNSAASAWAGVPVVSGTVTTAGGKIGENRHTLTEAELAAHSHDTNVNDPGHTHALTTNYVGTYNSVNNDLSGGAFGSFRNSTTTSHTTGIDVTLDDAGSDAAHNNVALTTLGTWFIKL